MDQPVRASEGQDDRYVPPVIRVVGTVEATLGKDPGVGDEVSFSPFA